VSRDCIVIEAGFTGQFSVMTTRPKQVVSRELSV